MTKKDYVRAAKIVNAERIPGFVKMTDEIREEIAHAFAHFFADDNPRFNKTRFLEACGVIVNDELNDRLVNV
jgi:hypothetical protein